MPGSARPYPWWRVSSVVARPQARPLVTFAYLPFLPSATGGAARRAVRHSCLSNIFGVVEFEVVVGCHFLLTLTKGHQAPVKAVLHIASCLVR